MSAPERTGIQNPGEAAQGVAGGLIDRGSDDRISLRRLLVPAGAIAISFLYILGGLAWRQLHQSDHYDDEFEYQSSRLIQIPAPRGHIYDRNGKLIVGNRPRFNIVADLSDPQLREKIHKTYLLFYRDARRRYESGATRTKPNITRLFESARVTVLQGYLDQLTALLPGHNEKVLASDISRHLRGKLGLNFPMLSDIKDTEVAVFVENFPEEYPLRLYVDSVRNYEFGNSAAHVLGYLRDSDNLGEDTDIPSRLADIRKLNYPGQAGKTGLELEYGEQLQGKPGSQLWRVKPTGYLDKKLSETKPEQGAHIYCSLDMDLQLAAEAALAKAKSTDESKEQLNGAAIAIDIATGEVLALASFPRFDPNEFAKPVSNKRYKEIEATGGMLNLATQGVFPPGSTFKVITAIAGMRSGALDPDEVLRECGSSFEVSGKIFKEHDGASFGDVDLVKMLRVSCNVYCYKMGLRIGIQPIADEARRLGLDTKIDLGKIETTGALIVPDQAWNTKTKRGRWSPIATANTAIGQGDLRTTPLHMAAMIASVAGNRTRTELSLIHDPGRDGVTINHHGEPLGLTAYQRKKLIEGMRACVESGTGKPVHMPGLDIVGKTGTAEFTDKGKPVNLAWFEGFAPGDNPKIAVVVMIKGEHGSIGIHGGASAGPIAKAIFAKWLDQHAKAGEKSADTPATE